MSTCQCTSGTCAWCAHTKMTSPKNQKPASNDEITPMEAFWVWYKAYSKNYGGTGLCMGDRLAEQAWKAALNYAEQAASKAG